MCACVCVCSLWSPIFTFISKKDKFWTKRLHKYGHLVKTHMFGLPVIKVSGADNLKKVLMSEHNLVSAQWPHSVQKLLGQGSVSTATGNVHRDRRKILLKAFTHDALEGYVGVIQRVSYYLNIISLFF